MVLILHFLRDDSVTFELRLEWHRKEFDLVIAELWVPEVKNEVDSCAGTIIPSLVIKRIIKDDAFVLY